MKLRDTQSFKAAKNMAGLSWLVNGILGTIFGGLAIGSFKKMGRAEAYNKSMECFGDQEVEENFDAEHEKYEKDKHN